jgi:hypothetical protein
MSAFRAALRSHPVIASVMALALVAALAFGGLAISRALSFRDLPTDPPIAGWMTPAFVARSWQLPPEMMMQAIDGSPGEGRRLTLDAIAAERGLPLADLVTRIEEAIAEHRARQ